MKGAEAYRKHLLAALLTTRWPRIGQTDEQLQALAVELGLQPELLREAREAVNAQRAERGTTPVLGRKTNEKLWPQLEIDMPEKVFVDWHAWCERQCSNSNAMIRGLLHVYLLGRWEPAYLSVHWRYKGEPLAVPKNRYEREHKAAWPFREKVLITRGVRGALNVRAERMRLSAIAIARGLILEVLEGRRATVLPVEPRMMYHDAERYLRHL